MASSYSGSSRDKSDLSTRLSMKISGILRHGRDGFKSHIDKNGWLEISTLLRNSHFCQNHHITYDQIVAVVNSNDKQRYKISEDGLRIKANQGHTIDIDDESLQRITPEQASTYSAVVHGTYYKVLNLILRFGLSKMKRNHIHLTASDRVDASIGVISGFRGSCEILIYIDICKAIKDGIEFFVSENNVILCSGNDDGVLESKYFIKVFDRTTNKDLEIDELSGNQPESQQTNKNESDIETKKGLQKQIGKWRKKLKEIDDIDSDLKSGKLKEGNLEKGQIEKRSRRKEYEQNIEKLITELRAVNSKDTDSEELNVLSKSGQSEETQTEPNQPHANQTEPERLEKDIRKLQKKRKEIEDLDSAIRSGKIKEDNLEKGQIEKRSKRKEYEENIEKLKTELTAINSKDRNADEVPEVLMTSDKTELNQTQPQSEPHQPQGSQSEPEQSKKEKITNLQKEIRKLQKKIKDINKLCNDLNDGKLSETSLEPEQREKISRKQEFEDIIDKLTVELENMYGDSSAQTS